MVEVTVYPRIDEIQPLPYTTGHDPMAAARQPTSLGRTGEDFYALRPYAVGDDLRRHHCPSPARPAALLIRPNELPSTGRPTARLTVRTAAHNVDPTHVGGSVAPTLRA